VENEAPVIDVTRLFTTEVPELSARAAIQRMVSMSRVRCAAGGGTSKKYRVEVTQTYTKPIDMAPPSSWAGTDDRYQRIGAHAL